MTATLVTLALRSILNRRRTLLLGLIGALMVAIAVVARIVDASDSDMAEFAGRLLADFGLGVLLPLVAVIVATSVIGSELDDGTIVYVLAKPVPRILVVAIRALTAWLVVTVLVAVPIFAAGVIASGGDAGLGIAYAVAATAGALEYTAVFVALSLVTGRALVIGLAYVVVWEGVVAGLFAGTRIMSVRQHALAIGDALGGDGAVTAELEPVTAVLMIGLVTIVAFAIAVRRLQSTELRGETS
jgi:ABC-2 type transport system permease protein